MSGHSKWSTIKRTKGVADAKRGVLFSRLAKLISIAVKDGGGIGDPTHNDKLRTAIERAKQESLPNANIDRAIKKGLGQDGSIIEQITYEGYGPGGVAYLIETGTDNKNRTVSNIKHLLSKHGGSLGKPGTVAWQFEKLGQITITQPRANIEELELSAIEAGAQDFDLDNSKLVIWCASEHVDKLAKHLEKIGETNLKTSLVVRANQVVELSSEVLNKNLLLIEEIDDDEDVMSVTTNLKI